jgi:hypothetical protein
MLTALEGCIAAWDDDDYKYEVDRLMPIGDAIEHAREVVQNIKRTTKLPELEDYHEL